MSVLTPDQAAEILERMKTNPPPHCDLCQIEFSDTEQVHKGFCQNNRVIRPQLAVGDSQARAERLDSVA
jgi:hypothetical protein